MQQPAAVGKLGMSSAGARKWMNARLQAITRRELVSEDALTLRMRDYSQRLFVA